MKSVPSSYWIVNHRLRQSWLNVPWQHWERSALPRKTWLAQARLLALLGLWNLSRLMVIGVCYNMVNMLLFPTHFRPIAPKKTFFENSLNHLGILFKILINSEFHATSHCSIIDKVLLLRKQLFEFLSRQFRISCHCIIHLSDKKWLKRKL